MTALLSFLISSSQETDEITKLGETINLIEVNVEKSQSILFATKIVMIHREK